MIMLIYLARQMVDLNFSVGNDNWGIQIHKPSLKSCTANLPIPSVPPPMQVIVSDKQCGYLSVKLCNSLILLFFMQDGDFDQPGSFLALKFCTFCTIIKLINVTLRSQARKP